MSTKLTKLQNEELRELLKSITNCNILLGNKDNTHIENNLYSSELRLLIKKEFKELKNLLYEN